MTTSDAEATDEPSDTPDWVERHPETRYLFRLARLAFYAVIVALVYYALSAVWGVLLPVFISLLIAYLLDPLIDWFEDRGVRRTLGIVVVICFGIVFMTLFSLFLYPTFVDQTKQLIDRIPELIRTLQNETIPWVERTFEYEVPSSVAAGFEKYGEPITSSLPTLANKVTSWAQNILTGTGAFVSGLINIVMIPIFSFFFLRDFDRMRLKMVEFLPKHRRQLILNRLREMDKVVGEWCRGQLQVASTLAVLYAIGLSVAFGLSGIDVKSGIAIGVLSGLLNFIPYFGVTIGVVLSLLMVILNGAGLWPLLGVALVFTLVQMLEGYLITPQLVGNKVGLSPVTVIILVLVGGELAGLLGIVLAIPMFSALKVLFPDLVRYYKQTDFYLGPTPDAGEASGGSASTAPEEGASPDRATSAEAARGDEARESEGDDEGRSTDGTDAEETRGEEASSEADADSADRAPPDEGSPPRDDT